MAGKAIQRIITLATYLVKRKKVTPGAARKIKHKNSRLISTEQLHSQSSCPYRGGYYATRRV